MYNTKTLLAAAGLTVTMMADTAGANAAPWDQDRGLQMRHDTHVTWEHHKIVAHERVFDVMRIHHYRAIGTPIFLHAHYVVRSTNRFGRAVFVEVDPYTSAFLGEIRI